MKQDGEELDPAAGFRDTGAGVLIRGCLRGGSPVSHMRGGSPLREMTVLHDGTLLPEFLSPPFDQRTSTFGPPWRELLDRVRLAGVAAGRVTCSQMTPDRSIGSNEERGRRPTSIDRFRDLALILEDDVVFKQTFKFFPVRFRSAVAQKNKIDPAS